MLYKKNKINLIFSVFALVSLCYGDNDGDLSVTGSGTIPFCTSWADGSSTAAPNWSTIDTDDYDTGYKLFPAIIQVDDLDANYAFNITATKSAWTLPAAYDVSNGAKNADGSDSDFLIQVSGISVGTTPGGTGGLTVANSHDSYQAATTGGAVILTGGSTTSGSAHGVETAQFTLDGKVMLDWATDIPGAYELSITLTIASQ